MNKTIKAVVILTLIGGCSTTDFIGTSLGVLKFARVVCTDLRYVETRLQSTLDSSVETIDASVDSSHE